MEVSLLLDSPVFISYKKCLKEIKHIERVNLKLRQTGCSFNMPIPTI